MIEPRPEGAAHARGQLLLEFSTLVLVRRLPPHFSIHRARHQIAVVGIHTSKGRPILIYRLPSGLTAGTITTPFGEVCLARAVPGGNGSLGRADLNRGAWCDACITGPVFFLCLSQPVFLFSAQDRPQ